MKHLDSSYTNIYLWATYMGKGVGGVKWARDLVFVRTVGTCAIHGGLMLLPSYV